MAEILQKLRPDRDLQCYFKRPSAIAALSGASPSGFSLSGCWRQQFDWAVLEWNRDNTFEHPLFRSLPNGDLSGLRLIYEETRENCIAIDSDLFPTVEWPFLRIWVDGREDFDPYKVPLRNYSEVVEGEFAAAIAEFELTGAPTPGDFIGLAWMSEHHTYMVLPGDTLEAIAEEITQSANSSTTVRATRNGSRIRLESLAEGANGNRMGAYGYVTGAKTEAWSPEVQHFHGGRSPARWRIDLDFSGLKERPDGPVIPMSGVRKLRWTYAADLQPGAFERSEFSVSVSNWTVTGTNREYRVAGPGSRRIEDDAPVMSYTGDWAVAQGNFSGGSIHHTQEDGATLRCNYYAQADHVLHLGTRKAANCAEIAVSVDDGDPLPIRLRLPGENVASRVYLGELGPGTHSVQISKTGPESSLFYFDFLETSVPCATVPELPRNEIVALATDWDTDHSIALPAERTAWMVHATGLHGRVNHYTGAMWFYELCASGYTYAMAHIDFVGTPVFGQATEIRVGHLSDPAGSAASSRHLNLIGDTAATIAKAFEMEINRGYTAIRATAQGTRLQIFARGIGTPGNMITLEASPSEGEFSAQITGLTEQGTLGGGRDGSWLTDTEAVPRINRAARDWSRSLFSELKSLGLSATAAFSMELQHGDPSPEAGIAQRCPDGTAVILNTPALQTNFSPSSRDYWQQVYLEMAILMADAGLEPYVQFGEVQWWYFPYEKSGVNRGMPFYDDYSRERFSSAHGREMRPIMANDVAVADYAEEAGFLASLIGEFTNSVISYVRQTLPLCRFEVLYPPDVNETEFNRTVNYPVADWTSETLTSIKTESFTYTFERNLDKSFASMRFPVSLGFAPHQRSHLVGISDCHSAWKKEALLAKAEGLESVVLFALDQLCLIGYPLPVWGTAARSSYMGG